MKYINKKQKIVLIIVIFIITLGISYYAYTTKLNQKFDIEEQNLEIEENKIDETSNIEENETSKILVHISGAVKSEGVVELEENSRVADAIELAGGVTENAYMRDVNLAEPLEDGMKVYIPSKDEIKEQEEISYNTSGSSIVNEKSKNIESRKNSKININEATKEELDTLPGIGESTANKIINYRNEHGKFKTIEEIKEVSGIGDSKYEQIKDLIEVWETLEKILP